MKDFIGAGSGAKRKKRYALQGSILNSLESSCDLISEFLHETFE